MKSILIISLGKKYGGAEKYTCDLSSGLAQRGYEVHLAVRKDGGLISKLNNTHMCVLDMTKKRLVIAVWELQKYINCHHIEIIHCNGINAMFLALFVHGTKSKIAVIHGDTEIDHENLGKLKKKLYAKLETLLLKYYKNCVTVSKSLKTVLSKRGVKKENITVIYNGIYPYDYKTFADSKEEILRICNVGNLLKVKGQIVLLQALNYVTEMYPNIKVKCDIYGIGECESELKQYIKEYNLENVRLCGFDDNVRDKLNMYHLYIQPSYYESFCLSAAEAVNAGCFVLASDTGGLHELIKTVKNGFLFPAGDYKKLADLIKICFEDREMICRHRFLAMQILNQKFSLEHMIHQLDLYYKRIG